jgi:hypothetical protein
MKEHRKESSQSGVLIVGVGRHRGGSPAAASPSINGAARPRWVAKIAPDRSGPGNKWTIDT